MRRITIVFAGIVLLVGAGVPVRAQLSISNTLLRVDFNTASGQFSVTDFESSRTFVTQGNFLLGSGGTAAVTTVTNAALGPGPAIQIAWSNGNNDAVMLFTNLPFAVFQSTLTNATAQTVVSNRVPTMSLLMDLGEPPAGLKALGTGGLTTPAGNPGSYEWLAVVDPTNRNGIVGGWITDDRACGIVFSSTNGSQVQLSPRLDYGRLQILPGQTETLEMFAVGYFADGRLGLEAWADTLARIYNIQLLPQPDGYCTWPSSPNGGSSNPSAMAQLADFAKTNLVPFGFSMIQLDDGWQDGISTNGPRRVFMRVGPTGPYAAGLKPTADYLVADGITPGIWFEPFAGTYYDPYFTNHLDWFVKTTNGAPYVANWAGTALDMTCQPARDYVSNFVYQIVHDWGFKYLKMDGDFTGTATPLEYINSGYKEDGMGDAVFADPAKANVEAFRDGMKLIRQAAGPDVLLLGNGIQNMRAYGGCIGLMDIMRIGPDNKADSTGSWSSFINGPVFGSRHYFMHRRVWYNDPDTAYVRDTVPLNHAQLLSSWIALTGELNQDGDWIPAVSPARLDILKRTMPNHGLMPRPVDYFENDPPQVWLLTDTRRTPRRDVIGLFNWNTTIQNYNLPLSHIGLPGTNYIGFEFWSNTLVPVINGSLQATVPPKSCQIIAVRPVSGVPQLISTSRHITQGIVDVLAENWDGTNTLSGTSQLVGGDPYELRIYLPNGWRLQTAGVSAADQAAGVAVSFTQTNGLARVGLLSPASRPVAWSANVIPVPVVTLTNPASGAVFYTNSLIPLAADAFSANGSITNVTFYNDTTRLGSTTGAPYNLTLSNQPLGVYHFTAVAADSRGLMSTSAVVQVQVQVFVPFSISATPASQNVVPNNSVNYQVTVTATNNFTDPVTLGIGGLPAGASSSFTPASVNGSGSSTLTVTVSNSAALGSYPLALSGVSGSLAVTGTVTLVVTSIVALPGPLTWNYNGTTPTTNWSLSPNWTNLISGGFGPPAPFSDVIFAGPGTVGTSNTINNVVDNDTTIDSLAYTNLGGYHATLIAPGRTLTIAGVVPGYANSPALAVGQETYAADNQLVSAAITGSGGTLVITNPAASVQIRQGFGSGTVGTLATLDMSGLGTFNASLSRVWLGVESGAPRRVAGIWCLARTNTLKLAQSLSGITGYFTGGTPALYLGHNTLSGNTNGSILYLGITNGIFVNYVIVGRGNQTNNLMAFNPAFLANNPTAYFRASDGVGRVGLWTIGDNSPGGLTLATPSSGTNDFTGGTVDALVDNLFVGRGRVGGTTATTGIGVLSFSAGTINVNTLRLGTMVDEGSSTNTSGSGTANVNGTATLAVNTVLELAHTNNVAVPTAAAVAGTLGTLNVNGGTVFANRILNGGGTATVTINGGALVLTNTMGTPARGLSTLNLTNGTLHFVLDGGAVLTNVVTANLNSGGRTLINIDSLAHMSDTATNRFPLIRYTTFNGSLANFSVNPLPGNFSGTLSNNVVTGTLDLIVAPPRRTYLGIQPMAGNYLVLSGSNGQPGADCYLLASTNLTVPWSNWTRVATNAFDANGYFLFSNAPGANTLQQFYLLQLH